MDRTLSDRPSAATLGRTRRFRADPFSDFFERV